LPLKPCDFLKMSGAGGGVAIAGYRLYEFIGQHHWPSGMQQLMHSESHDQISHVLNIVKNNRFTSPS